MSQYLYLSTSKFSFLKTGTISKIGASDLPQKTKKCLDILSFQSIPMNLQVLFQTQIFANLHDLQIRKDWGF